MFNLTPSHPAGLSTLFFTEMWERFSYDSMRALLGGMGVWFTAFAIATYLAGTLEQLIAHSGIPLYWFLVGTSVGAGVVLLMLNPLIKCLMHGVS